MGDSGAPGGSIKAADVGWPEMETVFGSVSESVWWSVSARVSERDESGARWEVEEAGRVVMEMATEVSNEVLSDVNDRGRQGLWQWPDGYLKQNYAD